jgi:HK97 family phage major capsid protein
MKHVRMPAVPAGLFALATPAHVLVGPRNEVDAGQLEKLLKEVQQQVVALDSRVKQTAEDALKQAKAAGEVSAETKKAADDLLVAQKKITDAQAALEKRIEQTETRNRDLEQEVAQRRGGGGAAEKSVGQRFAEAEEVRKFAQNGCKGTIRLALDVQQAITSVRPGGGGLIWSERETEIVGMPKRLMTIRNLLSVGRTSSNAIDYAQQTVRTNLAAPVAETAQKPESTYSWDQVTVPVRTIAHFVHVSRQAMEDAAQLQTEIDTELRYGLQFAEELQLLAGDGTGQNLTGLITAATAYSAPITIGTPTIIDILRLAILQASLAEYPADGIVMHPSDWARVELQKDSQSKYVIGDPLQPLVPHLWGRPVVDTQAISLDKFLVGAFKMAATIYDRMDPEVIASSEDRDNFIKNMITVRAEERLALAIKRPAGLIYGDFGLVP